MNKTKHETLNKNKHRADAQRHAYKENKDFKHFLLHINCIDEGWTDDGRATQSKLVVNTRSLDNN